MHQRILWIVVALSMSSLVGCGGVGGRVHERASANSVRQDARRPSGVQARIAEVTALLANIPQHGAVLGDPSAPETLQYFGDLECPFCRRFTLGKLTSLIQGYVRTGKMKIEYRSLRTATHDPETFQLQQVAALAAGEQNKLWNFIELFYREQGEEDSGYVTEAYLQGLAQQVGGLNLIAWTAARSNTALVNTLTRDARAAAEAGLRSTPSFLIYHKRGRSYAPALKKLLES